MRTCTAIDEDQPAAARRALAYTGFKDIELRLRAAANRGERLTEFGEKPVDARVELRARWYF